MDFTNINDPAGVSALLEQLRSSQVWAELQAQQTPKAPPESHCEPSQQSSSKDASSNAKPTPSVASLLSQLTPISGPSSGPSFRDAPLGSSFAVSHSATQPSMSPTRPKKDVRDFTFQQALPLLAQLSDDPAFVDVVSKLRRDQASMEKKLWEERQALHSKQAEKVKVAVTKANMLGTGISEREANTMRQVFEKELSQFDRERVLPAWDALIARQQATFEKLSVPAMFMASERSDRERQQRVIQVLEGIVGSDEVGETL